MRISPIATLTLCLLATSSWSADSKTAVTATAAPVAPVAPTAYSSESTTATGDPELMPPAAKDATPTAGALAASPTAAAVAAPTVEDDAVALSPTAALDLSKAETRLLAKISESIGVDQESILFNIEENTPSEKPSISDKEVNAVALFLELARRAVADEKEARQALSLAIVRGDKRAKDAKTEAYEERLAASLIKRVQNGDKGAKDELMKLALAGNKNARIFLELDKPATAPLAASPTVKTEAAPASVSPAAKAPVEAPKAPVKAGDK